MDDLALADALAHDLDAAFEGLVRAHADRCYTIALRLLGNPHDAEEVAQDALVRAYRALAGYDAARVRGLRLRPWLAAITVNQSRNRVRRRRAATVPWGGAALAGAEPEAPEREGPAAAAEADDERERLAALLAALPERYRVPVVLRHAAGLSYQEISAALGRPEGTLKAQVHRGLAMLRAAADGADAGAGADAQEETP